MKDKHWKRLEHKAWIFLTSENYNQEQVICITKDHWKCMETRSKWKIFLRTSEQTELKLFIYCIAAKQSIQQVYTVLLNYLYAYVHTFTNGKIDNKENISGSTARQRFHTVKEGHIVLHFHQWSSRNKIRVRKHYWPKF